MSAIYIKSTTEYYECSDSTCTKKTSGIETKDTCDAIGKLMNEESDYYICLAGTGEPKKLEAGDIALPYYSGTVFGNESEKYAIVTLAANSIKLKNSITSKLYKYIVFILYLINKHIKNCNINLFIIWLIV